MLCDSSKFDFGVGFQFCFRGLFENFQEGQWNLGPKMSSFIFFEDLESFCRERVTS